MLTNEVNETSEADSLDSDTAELEQRTLAFLAQRGVLWTTTSAWMCRISLPEVRRLAKPEDQVRVAFEAGFRSSLGRNRLLQSLIVLGLPVLGGGIAVVVATSCGISNSIAIGVFAILGMTLVYAGVVLLWGRLHRGAVRDVLADHGYPICRKCGYDRTGLQPAALCPECGSAPLDAEVERIASGGTQAWNERVHRESRRDVPPIKHRRVYIALWILVLAGVTWMSLAAPRPAGPGWYALLSVAVVASTVLWFKIWSIRR